MCVGGGGMQSASSPIRKVEAFAGADAGFWRGGGPI